MDVVGSEIGQKMRSAIKAKLTELGCYVDDELPDYVMVMVANKRTRAQMEDDLQLFLCDNTVQFVNWLHQVLKKLQEVTVTTPLVVKNVEEQDKSKDRSSSKDRKVKEKKDKLKEKHKKSDGSKKSKKKSKDKTQKKKSDKKSHKKKKNKEKETEMIRPNVPPLLMNMEKVSEPSITDVFAGQILKNHGITIETPIDEVKLDIKPAISELKRPIIPIIDPATITTSNNDLTDECSSLNKPEEISNNAPSNVAPREEQLKEINEIETKIQGLRQKLTEQLDSMSDDEDFLNIRTEAEELMTDFAEDVFQEISAANQSATDTPPLQITTRKSPSSTPALEQPKPIHKVSEKAKEPEVLPHIELNLPKRPVRERLGTRNELAQSVKSSEAKKRPAEPKDKDKERQSSERYTPEKEPDFWPKSAKSRLGEPVEMAKRSSFSEDSSPDKPESSSKRLTSKVSILECPEAGTARPRSGPASVVRVRPRPRPAAAASASNLLLRAVADAHKSLLNAPGKKERPPVKRGIVLPMRRAVDAHKIVIVVPSERASDHDTDFDSKTNDESTNSSNNESEYIPASITKKIVNTNYVPSHWSNKPSNVDETIVVETINNHKTTTTETAKGPTFVVTLDGLDPNIFLAKKLKTEGLIDDEAEITKEIKQPTTATTTQKQAESVETNTPIEKKRLSDTSEESDTQVIIQAERIKTVEKRKSIETTPDKDVNEVVPPPVKKRRASPIVFNTSKIEKEKVRERTDSVSSDTHVTVTTTTSSHKYDKLPTLSQAEHKLPCRSFPTCRFGAACAFSHPACKFGASCTRRHCLYAHSAHSAHSTHSAHAPPALASHVVPVANFKSITPASVPNMCKYYPNCANPSCHFYHPKPCRYGNACTNKLECNFYHHELQSTKWRVS